MNSKPSLYACFATAFSFLTRLPLPGTRKLEYSQSLLTNSMMFYPIIGLVFGLFSYGAILGGSALQLDPTLTAFVLVAIPYILNRFLHFDGLCDVLDGFLADRSPTERLAIMKDSRNGSFAMGGAILFLLAKFLILLNLIEIGYLSLAIVILAPVVSRWILVPMAFRAHYPREQGTALALVGRISISVLLRATVLFMVCLVAGFALAMVTDGRESIFPLGTIAGRVIFGLSVGILCSLGWMIALRRLAKLKIGGVTGDVLGCLCESGELVFLISAFLSIHIFI